MCVRERERERMRESVCVCEREKGGGRRRARECGSAQALCWGHPIPFAEGKLGTSGLQCPSVHFLPFAGGRGSGCVTPS